MNRLQRGQAMVETAVAAGLFAVVLCGLPCLLAYQDVQRTALRGARDTVFLAGWYRDRVPEPELLGSLQSGLSDLPWRHPADGTKLLSGDEPGEVRLGNGVPPGEAARLLDFIAAPLRGEGSYLGRDFELEQRGLRSAMVGVTVPAIAGAPEPFSTLELPLQERAVLLTDSWNAGSPAHVAERVRGLVPTALLRGAQAPARAFSLLLAVLEPDFRKLCPGLVEPERVPPNRIRGRALTSAAEEGRCR